MAIEVRDVNKSFGTTPVTSTWVPTGREPDVQPFVSVLPPVPEQWAAWPMYTLVPS